MKVRMYAVVNQENGKIYEDKLYKSQHRANVVKHIRNMTSRDHYHTEWIEVDISEPLYQVCIDKKLYSHNLIHAGQIEDMVDVLYSDLNMDVDFNEMEII